MFSMFSFVTMRMRINGLRPIRSEGLQLSVLIFQVEEHFVVDLFFFFVFLLWIVCPRTMTCLTSHIDWAIDAIGRLSAGSVVFRESWFRGSNANFWDECSKPLPPSTIADEIHPNMVRLPDSIDRCFDRRCTNTISNHNLYTANCWFLNNYIYGIWKLLLLSVCRLLSIMCIATYPHMINIDRIEMSIIRSKQHFCINYNWLSMRIGSDMVGEKNWLCDRKFDGNDDDDVIGWRSDRFLLQTGRPSVHSTDIETYVKCWPDAPFDLPSTRFSTKSYYFPNEHSFLSNNFPRKTHLLNSRDTAPLRIYSTRCTDWISCFAEWKTVIESNFQ